MTVLDGPDLIPQPVVLAAIDAVFSEDVVRQSKRVGLLPSAAESPGQWINRVRKAALIAAVSASPEQLL